MTTVEFTEAERKKLRRVVQDWRRAMIQLRKDPLLPGWENEFNLLGVCERKLRKTKEAAK